MGDRIALDFRKVLSLPGFFAKLVSCFLIKRSFCLLPLSDLFWEVVSPEISDRSSLYSFIGIG